MDDRVYNVDCAVFINETNFVLVLIVIFRVQIVDREAGAGVHARLAEFTITIKEVFGKHQFRFYH